MTVRSRRVFRCFWLIPAALSLFSCGSKSSTPVVAIAATATRLETIGALELSRYLYLRTGRQAPVDRIDSLAELDRPTLIVTHQGRLLRESWQEGSRIERVSDERFPQLSPEDYWLRSLRDGERTHLLIAGGDGPGILYGVYAFLEKLGIRFSLDGDIVPEERIPYEAPLLDEVGRPLFAIRGIQPFHDFPEGPDWWSLDNYKAVLGQLPKLRMNFFGLHTYPEKGPNAEPAVWIGLPDDVTEAGNVLSSYPSSWQNTMRGNWGYRAKKTNDFHFGANLLFERDDYGNDVMENVCPEPKTAQESDDVFNRAAKVFREAFGFARGLGVKTCVGTETFLTVPELVRQRLGARQKDPKDPAVVRELYRGIFNRIARAYPVDYYWFWTPEGWTWDDATAAQVEATASDLRQALEAARETAAPFGLATCGWVLGPPSDRTLFDRIMPRAAAVSCINREVGRAPVDPGFSRVKGRPKWAIPWMEDDPSLTSPQLWAGRMRRDAVDALRYGCDGLLGIHWRTRILSPNVMALAGAAWNQSWSALPKDITQEDGPLTGQYVSFKDKDIAGTNEDAVYQDVRDRVFAYSIPVPDGTYTVTLKFVEGQIERKRGRVFDVDIQGRKVLEGLDIFDRAGAFKALDFTFPNIVVRGGRLAIDFTDRINYPAVAGIVIRAGTYVKRINCGGPALRGYEADWPETPRHLPALDFYRDWASAQFGTAGAEEIAGVFSRLDGRHPIPAVWTDGPGGIVPNMRPWPEVAVEYGFVDELASHRPKVMGKSNMERFDYWLRNFEYMREMARFTCLWGRFNQAMDSIKAEPDEQAKARLARETVLPVRSEMAASLKTIFGHLLATVSNTGEMGTVANWEQHLLPAAWEQPGEELKKILGGELPPEAELGRTYEGSLRVFVPALRTSLQPGEVLRLKVIILSQVQPDIAEFMWRKLGKGSYNSVPLQKIARGVYRVECPVTDADIEYYIKVKAGAEEAVFPAAAPDLTQTVIVFPAD